MFLWVWLRWVRKNDQRVILIYVFLLSYLFVSQPGSAGWRNVFYVTAAIYLFGTIFYVVFGTGEQQKWNNPSPGGTDDDGAGIVNSCDDDKTDRSTEAE